MTQNAEMLPMAYGGNARQAHAGAALFPWGSRNRARERDAPSKTSGDKEELAKLDTDVEEEQCHGDLPDCGRPTWLSAPAKPKPCNRPKANAITHGYFSVNPGAALCRL